MSRLIAGARPTGSLHLGHYFGMFDAFVRETSTSDCEALFVVADLHMFTTNARAASTSCVPQHIEELIIDCMSAGLTPSRCVFYVQSDVLQQAQIYAILQSLVPHQPLLQQPSYRAMVGTNEQAASLGLLGYPVLECADVIGVGATHVAVGEHNVEHVCLAQRVIDSLASEWGLSLPRPVAFTAAGGNIVGLDGTAKMSKSLNNSIALRATTSEVEEAISRMALTDSQGRCLPARLLSSFGDAAASAEIERLHRSGNLSPDDARHCVFQSIERILNPMRARRQALQQERIPLREILSVGAARARSLTASTLSALRTSLHFGSDGL